MLEKALVDLGTQPLVNNLCNTERQALDAQQYKLCARVDDDMVIELDTIISPDTLYKDYLYSSSVSKPFVNHCRLMWHAIKHLKHKTIIDVGGNDGTLLKAFQSQTDEKLRLINVDASTSFREANEAAGIEYVNDYFSASTDVPKADLIISTNSFQHTPDADKYVEGVAAHLDGVWILEFPYALRTLETLQYDQFYHEHFYYWLVTPLKELFARHGLNLFHAEEVSIHGGSMRLWITNKDTYASEIGSVQKYLQAEKDIDWEEVRCKIIGKIHSDRRFLQSLEGKTAFFGAAAKGCVFLNAVGFSSQSHPHAYIVDDTPAKQGKYVPGTGLPIRTRNFLLEDQPDNLVILAHNFKDHIIKSLRPDYKGRIITILPEHTIDMPEDCFYEADMGRHSGVSQESRCQVS